MNKGRVKWFNGEKGFGLMERENGGDVLVDLWGMVEDGYKCLEEGESVELDMVEGAGGEEGGKVVKM